MEARRVQRWYDFGIFLALLLSIGYSLHLNHRLRILEREVARREAQESRTLRFAARDVGAEEEEFGLVVGFSRNARDEDSDEALIIQRA
jgi:hypothetical protein